MKPRRSMLLALLAIALTAFVLTVMSGCGSRGNPASTRAPETLASFLEKYRTRGFETIIDAAPEFIADLLSVRETAQKKDFDDLGFNDYSLREKVLFSRPINVRASCYDYSFTLWIRFEVYGAQNFDIGRALARQLFAQLGHCLYGSINDLDDNIHTVDDFVAASDIHDVNSFSLYWSEITLVVNAESIQLLLSRG